MCILNTSYKKGDKMNIAIFDFDGTLYKKETFPLLMKHLKYHPIYKKRYRSFFAAVLLPYLAYKCKLYKEEKMKYNMMQSYVHAFKGLTIEEVNHFFKTLAEKMIPDINTTVKGRLEQHAKDGMEIYIVSGAFTPLIEYVTKDLPVSHIIATNIPFKNGVYHSTEPITHVQGITKCQLIKKALKSKQVQWSDSISYADSYSDIPILELVGKPICVHPDDALQIVAKQKGWEILD